MDGVYGYIWLSIVPVCLLQPLQYESIPLLESRILLYFFLSACRLQSRNLAILSCCDSPFYTATTISSILHSCMYVLSMCMEYSEMRSISWLYTRLSGNRPIDHGHSKSQPSYEGVIVQSTTVTSEYIVPQDSFESSQSVLVLPRGPCRGSWLAVVVPGYLYIPAMSAEVPQARNAACLYLQPSRRMYVGYCTRTLDKASPCLDWSTMICSTGLTPVKPVPVCVDPSDRRHSKFCLCGILSGKMTWTTDSWCVKIEMLFIPREGRERDITKKCEKR